MNPEPVHSNKLLSTVWALPYGMRSVDMVKPVFLFGETVATSVTGLDVYYWLMALPQTFVFLLLILVREHLPTSDTHVDVRQVLSELLLGRSQLQCFRVDNMNIIKPLWRIMGCFVLPVPAAIFESPFAD